MWIVKNNAICRYVYMGGQPESMDLSDSKLFCLRYSIDTVMLAF